MKYDYLVVGAGLFGATFAEQMALRGKKVLVIDKRSFVSGNAYTEKRDGIKVHKYGAHIFHTNNENVWKYVNQFTKFNNFINSPIAKYYGKIYSLPFNMHTFTTLWGINNPDMVKSIIKRQSDLIQHKPRNLEEQAIKLVGTDIYRILIKGYTEKQWGRKCSELPPDIIKRIPVRFTYNNNYFDAKYQGIPVDGYTIMVDRMLTSDNIDVMLNADFFDNRKIFENIANKILFTGSIDSFFDYEYGHLQYRSLHFEQELIKKSNYQGNAVVNYTDSETPFTRIIEHKWFDGDSAENIKHTIISREYPIEWKKGYEPYYPINDEKNNKLYSTYKELANAISNKVIFGGRLGKYKYFDMDKTIESALECVNNEICNQ